MMPLRFICLVACILCLTLQGCGKRNVQIDRETRRMIDTLTAHELNILRPQMDSMCRLQLDSLVATLRDSVLEARKAEMRKLLGK